MGSLSIRATLIVLSATSLTAACTVNTLDANTSKNMTLDNDVWVILMGGQSNMAGTGGFENLTPEVQGRVIDAAAHVRLVNKGAKSIPLAAQYSQYQEDKLGQSYVFGPELIMATQLAEAYPQRKFLIIKTAHGSTSLYGAWNPNWSKGKATVSEKGDYKQNLPLYSKFLTQTKEALAQLDAAGESYDIKGFGWFQGESDSNRQITAEAYEHLISKLIASYRKDLNTPNLPFVLGQINNNGRRYKIGVPMVRDAIENVAENDSNVTMIPTSTDTSWRDYPKHKDNVHYNAEGQKRLGEAYAKAFIDFWAMAETK